MSTTAACLEIEARAQTRDTVAQGVILTLLYAMPALVSLRSFAVVKDNDIWWHLAAGNWILRHRAIPHTDPFSAFGMGKHWAAYSWGFELPTAWLVAHVGLMGLVVLHCVLITAIVIALHRLIVSLCPDFTIAALLTLAGVVAMGNLFTPRPWLVTILFFILELHIILQVRNTGQYRQLLWLLLIFCVWANLHAQFVYGLFLLMLAAADAWWKWWNGRDEPLLCKARNAWTVAVLACVVATLINPYFIGIYKVAFQLGTQPGVLNLISELQPIPFRSINDYLLVVVGLGGVASLAWRQVTDLFPWTLLAWALLSSFRSRRDLWMMAVVGAVILAAGLSSKAVVQIRSSRLQTWCVGFGVVLVMTCALLSVGISSAKLQQETATTFPVAAVEVVKAKHLGGPLFNHYDWGGYLIYTLPELPVSMDGRSALHGTPRLERSIATWDAKHDWDSDPELQRSNLVIGSVDSPLSSVLRIDPRYELVYEDKVASVFIRRKPENR